MLPPTFTVESACTALTLADYYDSPTRLPEIDNCLAASMAKSLPGELRARWPTVAESA